MRFKKYCDNCEKLFRPTGKAGKLCEKCYILRKGAGKRLTTEQRIQKLINNHKEYLMAIQLSFAKDYRTLINKYEKEVNNGKSVKD